MLRSSLALLLLFGSLGCHAETVGDPSPGSRENTGGAAQLRPAAIVGPLEIGGRIESTLEADEARSYVAVLAQGAQLSVDVSGAEVSVYGPLGSDGWEQAPVIARGDAPVVLSVPADGTYLFEARATSAGRPFSLALACQGAECRVTCGPEESCPTGARCALVMCIRAPCPSYCEAVARTVE